MKVSTKYEVIPNMQCIFCDFEWNACIEFVELDLDEVMKDYLFAEELVCPNCQIITPIIRENEY